MRRCAAARERESTCKQCPRSHGNPLLQAAVFPLKIAHQAVDRLGAACGNGWTGWTGWTGGQTVCAAGETYMASSVDRPQAVLAGGSVTVSARVSACREQGADGPNSGECAGTGASRCGSDMSGSSCAPTPYSTHALSPPEAPPAVDCFGKPTGGHRSGGRASGGRLRALSHTWKDTQT